MNNIILEKKSIEKKVENIYFMKYIIMDNKKINRENKIQNIIDKNKIYEKINNISEIDKIAYNI